MPKLYLNDTGKCSNEAYRILRLFIAGCWRKYQNNNIAINSCLDRGEKISKEWGLLCKTDIKYQPTRANIDKNMKCEDQAYYELKIYMADCYKKHKENHFKFKECILDGKTLAELWGERCGIKIKYNPVIPDEMPKVKENTSECVKKAKIFLKVYEKDCWNNHRGIYKATMDCLRKGSDHAEKFKKECGTEIEYYPRLPERKTFV